MDHKALESAIETLKKEAKKVMVEYNMPDGVIIICAGNQSTESDICTNAQDEHMRTLALIETNHHRLYMGHLFNLSDGDRSRQFQFLEVQDSLIPLRINERDPSFGVWHFYCQVTEIRKDEMDLRLDLLDGIVIEKTIRFQDLYFFDLL